MLLVILITGLYYTSSIISIALTRVPPVSSPKFTQRKVIEITKLKPGQIFYDLGSGNGSFLLKLAKKYPKSMVVGFEISLFHYLYILLKKLFTHSTANIKFKNFFKQDISNVDIFYCYLWPSIMKKVIIKFDKEAKKSARLIVYAFPIDGRKPDITHKYTHNNKKIEILEYIKK